MNRRGILSTLCTGALALLAPVAAFAKPWRKARIVGTLGIKPMVITPPDEWTPEQIAEFRAAWERESRNTIQVREPGGVWEQGEFVTCRYLESLRALLAEAREEIAVFQPIFATGTSEAEHATDREYADLLTRIDAALKGHSDA